MQGSHFVPEKEIKKESRMNHFSIFKYSSMPPINSLTCGLARELYIVNSKTLYNTNRSADRANEVQSYYALAQIIPRMKHRK